MPFHFWSVVFFVIGSMVGSFLNVCISHAARAKCHHPAVPLSQLQVFHSVAPEPAASDVALPARQMRELQPKNFHSLLPRGLLTGLTLMTAWMVFGERSVGLAIVYCLVLAGFIIATFIDLDTSSFRTRSPLGARPWVLSFRHSCRLCTIRGTASQALKASFFGILIGGGLVYFILRGGKLAFGKEKVELAPESRIIFKETSLQLPDKELRYEEIFYRKSDYIELHAKTVEIQDRCYWNTTLTLTPAELKIGEEKFNPEEVPHMEVVTSQLILPREAMGFGDVKFMAAIGAFLGWPATIFSLMVSAVLGTLVSLGAIAIRRVEWTSRIPYGPYIAVAAIIYMFLPQNIQAMWRDYLSVFGQIFSSKPI